MTDFSPGASILPEPANNSIESGLKTPVLLLVFNRPRLTAEVFEALRKVRPARLYIAADGPRENHPEDQRKVAEVRTIVQQIDWPCQLFKLFREHNRGCKHGVSEAISWFFSQEDQGIILEDDILPEPRFFHFIEKGLNTHRENSSIGAVCGYNLLGAGPDNRPFLAHYPHIWGWGTWSRVWSHYQVDPDLSDAEYHRVFSQHLGHAKAAKGLTGIGRLLRQGKFNSWDFQLGLLFCRRRLLALYPPINLAANIGFGPDATHTENGCSAPTYPDTPFVWEEHEPRINREYDRLRLDKEFPGTGKIIKQRLANLRKKLVRKVSLANNI